ncbi:3-hydroxyacyl-[acyl-carrier-protein] dehydratase FabZ [bacterium HR36]|nr:3-hydroxyacyl-[acyl-carrier-protein] dehydratase FabZ [bacterium HR36]
MRFWLLDGITSYAPGKFLEGYKQLTLGEEYLAEHFPTFPVMPGVLMLEALVQAGAWLIRLSEDFTHSVVVLRQAKGIKYGNFVQPGERLCVRVDLASAQWPNVMDLVWLKAQGTVNGTQTVSARIGLARYNLADLSSDQAELDAELKKVYRRVLSQLLRRPAAESGKTLGNLRQ